ncbi:hypothetical protein WJX75_004152 [Coccomyxa subellipsoidea]|uniref:Sialidase domain-containing protein n=1 Tax=Coccomyxa subellipsoidea TaxID=248742 RepID=A0ABR2YRI4_9CHLO
MYHLSGGILSEWISRGSFLLAPDINGRHLPVGLQKFEGERAKPYATVFPYGNARPSSKWIIGCRMAGVRRLVGRSRKQCWWRGEGGMHWACGGDIFLKRSFDSGRTWLDPKVVYSFDEEGGIAKMIANKLVVNSRGHFLLPFWREMGGQPECNRQAALHGMPGLLVSDDKGGNWRVINITIDKGEVPTWLIEGALAKGRGTREYILLFRTSAGRIYSSRSHDDGMHWTPAIATQLANPNSKVDVISLPQDVLLLAYNDDTETFRSTLALASSVDAP